jgi:hypothetical protein
MYNVNLHYFIKVPPIAICSAGSHDDTLTTECVAKEWLGLALRDVALRNNQLRRLIDDSDSREHFEMTSVDSSLDC